MQDRASVIPPEPQRADSDTAISSQEVEAELAKVLASPLFRRAPRHSCFLEFVVRKKLAGSEDCVKESLIGVEVFGRPAGYDSGSEPAVRVEAGRLRLRLTEYYRGLGRHDPIQIHLPKGTYIPVFSRNGVESSPEEVPDTDCLDSVADSSSPAANGGEQLQSIPSQPSGGRESSAHPAVSHAGRLTALKIGAAVAAFGVAAFILIRMLTADNRPASGRLDGSTLIIANAQGQQLWRRSFPDGFALGYYEQGLLSRIWFGDLDGSGHTDVLFFYHPAVSPGSHSTTLICYSDRGKEKWRWTPGRNLPELESGPATFYAVAFGVLRAAAPGGRRRIVVSSYHTIWYPHQIAILDSNGKMVSEYWHSGHLDYLMLADIDGDGREEIVASGISNGYRQATLLVLDPDRVFGASAEAARPEIQIHGVGVAQERLRLVFPRSDINKRLAVYNEGKEVSFLNGKTRLSVLECPPVWQNPHCEIWYEFDRDFHLLSAMADDQFRGAHDGYYLKNEPVHRYDAREEREFQKVRCLVGCKTEFVLSQVASLK